MEPKRIKSDYLGEEYFHMNQPSGLNIYIYPKRGYSSNYAILGTNFGSVNNKFKLKGQSSFTQVPDGVAHYLEHKLFAGKEQDAFELFAKTGASANAYTTFDKTAYLFSCTGNFEASLNILLEFVQSPYFTAENVEKERGIIEQEIKMYQDSPDWKVLINLLSALYKNHPVRADIAGTVESIAKITPETLYECYNTFYNLHNMSLCVVGDVDVNKTLGIIDKQLKYSKPLEVERFFPEEPQEVTQKFIAESFDMQSPMFQLGFKEKVQNTARLSAEQLVYTDILLKCISSKSSQMYNELLSKELINTASFSYEYFEGPGYASAIFSGESKNPEKVSEIIHDHVSKIKKSGIDKETFERAKKAIYGQSLSVFNSISGIANLLLDFSFSGKEIFSYVDIIGSATLEKVNERLTHQLDENYSALSIVKPR